MRSVNSLVRQASAISFMTVLPLFILVALGKTSRISWRVEKGGI